MNIQPWLSLGKHALAGQRRQMEAKLERHAGLLLWTFSPITVSGLMLHQPALSGQSFQLIERLIPLSLIGVLAPLPWLGALALAWWSASALAPAFCRRDRPKPLAVTIAWFITLVQHALVCASGAFLALFVLCAAHRQASGAFECLTMAVVPMVALAETLCLEDVITQLSGVGPVMRIGRFRLDLFAALGSCGSTCALFYLLFIPA
ncbi:MAG: hypothetical protein JO069_11340 [Verrucomicrobia bacterium]|nr:hypothetical protein [Verrucomicrobiota bacterium]